MDRALNLSRRDLLATSAVAAMSQSILSQAMADDPRLSPLKDYDGKFMFTPPTSWEDWQVRAEYVRRQTKLACGLWPMPTRGPINATIHGKVERDDFTVERVFFESSPGLYVTGSLFRPKGGGEGKRPAVLCPHGHWQNGRFFRHPEAALKKELDTKAEVSPKNGSVPLQARCVHLARMGCTVFLYDMLGYADSVPFSGQLIHGFAAQTPQRSDPAHWGLFSAQSELRLINALGLQTWNSVRIVDWMTTLPDVDPSRIGVTGASGGGTQTFILGVVDSRPTALAPVVMVSTAMQGGCTCENATYLRVDTGNIEFTALLAPRPVALVAAEDWTKDLERLGLPELQTHFARMGVPDRIVGKYFPFAHNYNSVSRKFVYEFFRQNLQLPESVSLEEREFEPLSTEELTVWSTQYPKPMQNDAGEQKVLRWFAADQDAQFASLIPKDAKTLENYRSVIGGAWDIMIGRSAPNARQMNVLDPSDITIHLGPSKQPVVRNSVTFENSLTGERVSGQGLVPLNGKGEFVVWVDESGSAALFQPNGAPTAAVERLLVAGIGVVSCDLWQTGKAITPGTDPRLAPKVKNPREFLGYTLGFNHSLFSRRVHDLLMVLTMRNKSEHVVVKRVSMVGTGQGALWAAAAAVQAGKLVDRLALDTQGFRWSGLSDVRDPRLVPGAVRYGDVPGLLALLAPRPLFLQGEGMSPAPVVAAAYRAAGVETQLAPQATSQFAEKAVDWLIGS